MNTELHRKFVEQFHIGKTKQETEQSIADCQNQLTSVFPDAYQSFMKNHGECFCPEILNIMDDDSDVWPLQNIWNIKEVIESTNIYRQGGMPEGFIVFASDCMGNAFCFNQSQEKQPDAPVHFYDHDFDKISQLTESFDDWLKSYLDLTGK